jgi:PAS domain S-box-containing protein
MLERLRSLGEIRGFIEEFPHPMIVTRGPLVVSANEAWLSAFGYIRERVEGGPYLDFMPVEERTRLARRAALRDGGPSKVPFSRMTTLALKADGTSTVVHVQPTVLSSDETAPLVLSLVFAMPERDPEIELAELLVATSTSLAKARTVAEVRRFAVTQLAEGGHEAAFFRPNGAPIHPADARLPSHVSQSDLDEAMREGQAIFVGPDAAVPETAIVCIQREAEPELMAITGPRLVSPLRAALRLFAQGVGSALETATLIADLERRNRELSDTRAELVRHERLAALGEMAASVAHEVRNPVGVIANAVSTLRKKRDDRAPQSAELLSIIDEECVRLERMVRDLLEFARPRTVRFTLEALSEIAEEAIATASSQSDPAMRRAEFEIRLAPDMPKVRVDRELLRQALINLLINAAQGNPDGGTIVVRIATRDVGHAVVPSISVEDRGSGIPEDIMGRIFDPFFTTRAQGSGLGLAVVKRIADALRAQIAVESRPGHGSTFTLTFPI